MTGRAPPGSDAGMGSLPQFPLLGLRILLAEDDYLIAFFYVESVHIFFHS